MCAGYGGLEMGLRYAGLDFDLEWVAENDKWASEVLEERFGVPNLGSVTEITDPPKVDLCIAGFPCQPLSTAGKRKGSDDQRWLIDDVVRVANAAGAQWLFLENVLGVYTTNEGEAFGQILNSLAEGGFDARWSSVRADTSCGVPHRRNRWFCIAYKPDGGESEAESFARTTGRLVSVIADSYGRAYDEERRRGCGGLSGAQEEGEGEGEQREWVRPVVADGVEDATDPENIGYEWSRDKGSGRDGFKDSDIGNDREQVVADSDSAGQCEQRRPSTMETEFETAERSSSRSWGEYEQAIRHWEHVFGWDAPSPIQEAPKGGTRLNPSFVEWMMGLPPGWVCDLDLPRVQQLKLLGNGVVPQQAAVAYLQLLGMLGGDDAS
jgi:DNA (cytosine-5)-methyltransferase 1